MRDTRYREVSLARRAIVLALLAATLPGPLAAADDGPLPDIVVDRLSIWELGGVPYLRVELRNAGEAGAANLTGRFEIDGAPGPTGHWPYLEAGQRGGWSIRIEHLAPGEHRAAFIADPADTIRETNESNNRASLAFKIPAPADISVRILSVERVPWHPLAGQAATQGAPRNVTVETCNRGPHDATVLTVLGVKARLAGVPSSEVLAHGTLGLAAGACAVETTRWDARAVGDVTLYAEAFPVRASPTAPPVVDPNLSNNRHEVADTVLVAGLAGGLVLPLP